MATIDNKARKKEREPANKTPPVQQRKDADAQLIDQIVHYLKGGHALPGRIPDLSTDKTLKASSNHECERLLDGSTEWVVP